MLHGRILQRPSTSVGVGREVVAARGALAAEARDRPLASAASPGGCPRDKARVSSTDEAPGAASRGTELAVCAGHSSAKRAPPVGPAVAFRPRSVARRRSRRWAHDTPRRCHVTMIRDEEADPELPSVPRFDRGEGSRIGMTNRHDPRADSRDGPAEHETVERRRGCRRSRRRISPMTPP